MAYNLKATIDNEIICEKTGAETYIQAFELLIDRKLINKSITVDFPSIAKKNKEEWSIDKKEDAVKIEEGIFISHHSSTEEKSIQLQKVFHKYKINGKVEIVNESNRNDEQVNIHKRIPRSPEIYKEQLQKEYVKNEFSQAICITGDSGVGKSVRVKRTLEKEGHKTLFVILDNMWQHILFDYSPDERKYKRTKAGDFIIAAHEDRANHYTIVLDECHKSLEIINDVLLQAISVKRNDGVRYIALNSLVDSFFSSLPEENSNRILPDNLGFIFISSKSNIIEGNDDFRNRIEIVELNIADRTDEQYSIEYLLNKIAKKEVSEYSN